MILGDTSLRRVLYTFCSPGDAAQLRSPTCAFCSTTYTRRTNIRKPPVLANIRSSAATGNGLSGTVTAPFPRQRSQKV